VLPGTIRSEPRRCYTGPRLPEVVASTQYRRSQIWESKKQRHLTSRFWPSREIKAFSGLVLVRVQFSSDLEDFPVSLSFPGVCPPVVGSPDLSPIHRGVLKSFLRLFSRITSPKKSKSFLWPKENSFFQLPRLEELLTFWYSQRPHVCLGVSIAGENGDVAFGASQGTLRKGFPAWLSIRLRTCPDIAVQATSSHHSKNLTFLPGWALPVLQWRWNCCFDFQEPGLALIRSRCSGVPVW